jgi:NADPH-dependent FMN reductase
MARSIRLLSTGGIDARSVRPPRLSSGPVAGEEFAREPRQLGDLGFGEPGEEALRQSAVVGVLRSPEHVQPGVGKNDDHRAGIPLVADPAHEAVCLQGVSGSTRRSPLNTRLAHLVGDLRPGDLVAVVTNLDRLPFYNADVEAVGTPPAVAQLRSAVAAADGVVIVTPEYNGTVPVFSATPSTGCPGPRASRSCATSRCSFSPRPRVGSAAFAPGITCAPC